MYEMKRVSFRKGWISAGRAIRLIHLLKLHEIDMPAGLNDKDPLVEAQQSENTLTVIEERRRTFWMGYFLDRMVNLVNQVPFTISEQSVGPGRLMCGILVDAQQILTRLPAPEEHFQAGRLVDGAFLFEVLRGTDKRKLSSFNNLLILVTLWGRGLLSRHRQLIDRFYGNESAEPEFYHRLQWLESIIAQSEQIMAAHGTYNTDSLDSMLLFTNMVAHAMLVSLCKAGSNGRRDALSNMSTSNVINGYEGSTSKAITEMLNLSTALCHYGQSNVSKDFHHLSRSNTN
ncbi:unnamed protein product [Aureobasidium vineae]|uniref:Xylanolytic transcriptional activator regulatory domain-containing protein n=1 Tax=Aureobasidium vineae TaxID=2773715 RepID=A0A9N8JHB4_9PEZI|nr:unnamed protein product [Aureobasidium vineae]